MTKKECLNRYLGISYVHLGRTLQGLDCYGLIKLVYKDIGFELIDLVDYDKKWSSKGDNLFVENYQKQWERVLIPKIFDVVLIKGTRGIANHAGLYFDSTKFLHCIKAGVVVGKFEDDKWGKNVIGFFRLKEAFNRI